MLSSKKPDMGAHILRKNRLKNTENHNFLNFCSEKFGVLEQIVV